MVKERQLRKVVEESLRIMLRPLIRLSLRYSFHLGEITELVKDVFVEMAKEDLQSSGQPVSFSKLSIMTGVHRKDVTRIERESMKTRSEANLIARIMVQWQHDSRFATKAKRPRVLKAEGRDSEFAALVRSLNGENISAYSVLSEMLRLGAVEKKGGKVSLKWRDFVIDGDVSTGIKMLASDIHDLSLSVESNLFLNEKTKNLHLKTEFDNISSHSLPSIRDWLIEEGSQFHRKARNFLSRFDRDTNHELPLEGGRCRVVLSAFSLCTQQNK